MRLYEFGTGKIVPGVNTTADVGVDEIKKQAKKFGNSVDQTGHPPVNPSGKITISEAVDYQWDWQYGAKFKVNNKVYTANFIQNPNQENSYEFEFSPTYGSRFGNNGDMGSSSIQVFSTVINILVEFLENEQPEMVHFTAEVSDNRGDLYTKLVKKYQAKFNGLNYKISIKPSESKIDYLIEKNQPNQG